MNKQAEQFLKILFNPGEEVYASPYKYSSIWDEEKGDWKYYHESTVVEKVDMNKSILIGLNPITGPSRKDENVTKYRTFLVELDGMGLKEQASYIKEADLPYSVCVFSGGKSLHFGITLDEDLPNEDIYRFYAEWLLKTVPKADQATKNPSRGIRFPGVLRPGGSMQALVKAKGRISMNKFLHYLNKFPDARPAPPEKKNVKFNGVANNKLALANWVILGLKDGFDFSGGRNNRWFSVGWQFGRCGYELETMIEILENNFVPDRSFGRSEWLTAIKSGHKKGKKEYFE